MFAIRSCARRLQALRTNSQQHIAFYANCQAVLYILCFRLEDLLDMEGGATFVSSLGLNMIVKSSLCPLLVCQKIVVKEFARLTKEHQIVYCAQYMRRQSVISLPVQLERGYRAAPSAMEPAPNQLEDFFPFDPYLLQVCARACVCFERQGRGRGSTWTWTRAHTHTHTQCRGSEPLPSVVV